MSGEERISIVYVSRDSIDIRCPEFASSLHLCYQVSSRALPYGGLTINPRINFQFTIQHPSNVRGCTSSSHVRPAERIDAIDWGCEFTRRKAVSISNVCDDCVIFQNMT